jgi:hypothetical protein
VAGQFLDGADVVVRLQEMGGGRHAKRSQTIHYREGARDARKP